MRYCQLSQFTTSFKSLSERLLEDEYQFDKFVVYGIVPDNMLTVQKIYQTFTDISKIDKCVYKDDLNDVKHIVNNTDVMIKENKFKLFEDIINNNQKLKDNENAFDQLIRDEEILNDNIINIIAKFMKPKLLKKKEFKCQQLCGKLEKMLA